MSWVGKNTVAVMATTICIALAFTIIMPLSTAAGADTTPPTTTATVAGTHGDNGWYKKDTVTVTLTAIDNGSGVANTYYLLDGAQHDYTLPFDVAEGDYTGTHTLAYFSKDAAGNIEGAHLLSIKVDTTAPTMNLTFYNSTNGKIAAPDTNGYFLGGVMANLTASDNTSKVKSIAYAFSYDSSTWYSYNGNFTLPDGQYTLLFGSYDNAGNAYNNTTVSVKVFNPQIDPTPFCDRWYNTDQTIYFTSPPSGDVNYYEYSYDGVTWYSTKNGWYPISLTTEGNNSLYYRGVNEAYGYKSAINCTWYGIDKSIPTMSISISGKQSSSGWYEGDIKVNLNSHDSGGIKLIQYSWDQSHWTDININPYKSNASASLSMSQQSSKTIYARCVDVNGDVSAIASQFIYFAPGSYDQGSMSGQVWINGQTSGGTSTGSNEGTSSQEDNPTPLPTPTQVPLPTPEQLPSPTPVAENQSGLNSPLAIGVLVAMLVLIVVAGIAAYLFVLKPK